MAYKSFTLSDGTDLVVYKRRNARNMRLSIASNGKVRVTIPSWTPYISALKFVDSKRDWIKNNQLKPNLITSNQLIGKAHRLFFIYDETREQPISRNIGTEVRVYYSGDITSPLVQSVAKRAAIRALKSQAESLLPQRLEMFAVKHGYIYKSVRIKSLKSRWGSCDQNTNIVLSLYLMQLPWELIDYVLIHELTHTKVLKHGPTFWQAMNSVLPNTKSLRQAIRAYRTDIGSYTKPSMA